VDVGKQVDACRDYCLPHRGIVRVDVMRDAVLKRCSASSAWRCDASSAN
jgi:hypothetical protein